MIKKAAVIERRWNSYEMSDGYSKSEGFKKTDALSDLGRQSVTIGNDG